jgi:predicted ATPase
MPHTNTKIQSLSNMLSKGNFYPYIDYIRFPAYKKFAKDTKINFLFPITALVGENGSNKSSVLRAIYSCPEKQSLSSFWFSTDLDTLPQDNAFVYAYYNTEAERTVEVVKTLVNKTHNGHQLLDYWEPSKPRAKYGMEPFTYKEGMKGCSQTRWNTIQKNVVYLDFRHTAISAFDKCFYFGQLRKTKTIRSKQDYIRRRSRLLNKFLKQSGETYLFRNKNRVISKTNLTQDLVKKISNILDKDYTEILIIKHTFFSDEPADTIILRTPKLGQNYTEAFAGSGEFSVISLVHEISKASDKSLILLDEPEVSIHPGAQKKLVQFLLDEAIKKKHQVVFSTHSPFMLSGLPPEAIHILYQTLSGEMEIMSNIPKEQAFVKIGHIPNKKSIVVEDIASKILVEGILNNAQLSNNFEVIIFPGGVAQIIKSSILDNALLGNSSILYLLDGDKRKEHKDSTEVSESELDDVIKYQTDIDVKNLSIPCSGKNGNSNEKEKIINKKIFLDFYKKHVFYLPQDDPENTIWDALPSEYKLGISKQDRKECFKELTKKDFGTDDSLTVSMTLRRCTQKINFYHKDCEYILNIIRTSFSV